MFNFFHYKLIFQGYFAEYTGPQYGMLNQTIIRQPKQDTKKQN